MNTRPLQGVRPIVFAIACLLLAALPAAAAQAEVRALDSLQPGVEWVVKDVEIVGSEHFSAGTLKDRMLTQPRSWYLFWRDRPSFDVATFERDLERLQRSYEAEGFFQATIETELHVEPGSPEVEIVLTLVDHARATVTAVDVAVEAHAEGEPELPENLPLRSGMPFSEAGYRAAETALRVFFLNRGFAHVAVERHAKVALDREHVAVRYDVRTGPEAVFGATQIEGLENIDESLLARELRYEVGERFSLERISETRAALLGLNLLSAVQLTPDPAAGATETVPMRLRVQEKAPREIRVGVGYSTEEEFGAQLQWSHYNWLGGGRQLTLAGQYSTITAAADVAFLQPYLLGDRRNRGRLDFRLFQQDEDTFTLNSILFTPSLQRDLTPHLELSLGFRIQAADVTGVDGSIETALGSLRGGGLLFGPRLGLRWNRADDPLRPTRGHVVTFAAEQVGEIWGGDYSFYKLTAEVAKYLSVGFDTVLAGRLKVGFVDAIGSSENLPIFERFYAGGEKSVRGYQRWGVGPRAASGDPLGGRSLLEGSVELRRPIWRDLGAVAFFDFGQVSLDRYNLPVENLQLSAGPGVTYETPVGPLSLYLAIPFDRVAGDAAWQIHFSIGHFF